MKKRIGISLIGLITAMLVTGCNIEINNRERKASTKNYEKNSGEKSYYTESFEIGDVDKIYLDLQVANVDMYLVDGNIFKIERTYDGNVYGEMTAKKEGDTIEVKEDDLDLKVSDSYSVKNDIKIEIPKEYKNNMEFYYGVGKCEIENITVDKFYMECGVGDVSIKDLTFNDMDMKLGVGKTNMDLARSGNMKINGGVGVTNIKIREVAGNLDFEGGVGESKIYVPVNSPIAFSAESGLGKCSTDVATSGENTYRFDLSTGIGELKVKELK